MKKRIFIALYILLCVELFAQEKSIEPLSLEQVVAEIGSLLDVSYDLSQLYDDLSIFAHSPINLNKVSREELERLQFLNEAQISNLLIYVKLHAPIYSLQELSYIAGMDSRTIRWLLPFVTLEDASQSHGLGLKQALKYTDHRLIMRSSRFVEEQRGYVQQESSGITPYVGDPWQHQLKYRIRGNDLEFGLSAEKDRGESYWNSTYGVDFLSAYLEVNKLGALQRLVLGSFHYQFGQGLIFWTGGMWGKGTEVLKVKKSSETIKRYSSGEGSFLRGAAATWTLSKCFTLSMLASYKDEDASLKLDSTSGEPQFIIENIRRNGLHRTINEIEGRKQTGIYTFGGQLAYAKEDFELSVLGSALGFKHPLLLAYKEQQELRQSFYNLGLSYQYRFNGGLVYGEYALDYASHPALLTGLNLYPSSRFSLSLLHRYYSPDYYAYYAGAFRESSAVANEHGLYLGLMFLPAKRWKFTMSTDMIYFPQDVYQSSQPGTKAIELLGQLDYSPQPTTDIMLRLKYEQKEKDWIREDVIGMRGMTLEKRAYLRLQIKQRLRDNITLHTRTEMSHYSIQDDRSLGYLILQDLVWEWSNIKAKFYFRYAYCYAPSFENRFFVYENDVLYAFSVPSYYGASSPYYIMGKFSVSKNINLWLKVKQIYYRDREKISSGYEEINGRKKTEFRVQLQWKF